MRIFLTVFLAAVFSFRLGAEIIPPTSDSEIYKGSVLELPGEVYGQVKLVPSPVFAHRIHKMETKDWSGPWGRYPKFQLFVTYSKSERRHPGKFKYVDPNIGLIGRSENRHEEHSRVALLFDEASTKEDILVKEIPIEGVIELDKEYHLAVVSNTKNKNFWDVYVRFSKQEPDYVKKAKEEKAKAEKK